MSDTVRSEGLSGIEVAQVTAPESIRAADSQSYTTQFEVPESGIQPTQIQFNYNTMPGNQPTRYGNTVFLWQTNAPVIPTGVSPMNSWSVTPNQPNGSSTFGGLSVGALTYLLGYATGPDVKNICATVFIPLQGAGISTTPSVVVASSGPTSLTYQYTMPQGTQPNADGDWCGLWEGQGVGVLYAVPPKAVSQVPQNTAGGFGFFNNVTLLRRTQYTVAYFKGGYNTTRPSQTTLACSVTFTTP